MTHFAQDIRLSAIAFVGGAFLSSAAVMANDGYVVTSLGKAGTGDVTPILAGSGELAPGGTNTLALSRARANSTSTLVVGFDEVAAPFKGGILGPSPDSLAFGLPIDALGKLSLPFVLPPDAPAGFDIWIQFWIDDAGVSANLSASNTLRLTISPFDGLGAMFPMASYPMGSQSSDVILRDIDDDGVSDILSSSEFSDNVSVLLGRADGTFESLPDVPTGLEPVDLEVADIDADGQLDLVVASEVSSAVSLHVGLGNGLFGPATSLDVGGEAFAVEVADINSDNVPDIVAISEPALFGARKLVTLLGLGAGTFSAPVSIPVTESFNLRDVHAVQLDGDGDVDLLIVATSELRTMLGDGNGNFALTDTVALGGVVVDVLIEDFNADGTLDYAALRNNIDDVMVITGQSDGTFDTPHTTQVAPGLRALTSSDLDLNGTLDLIVARATNGFFSTDPPATLSGLGDGTFAPPTFIPTAFITEPLITGTINDGATPLLVDAGRGIVILGDGVGGFVTPIHHESGPSPGKPTVLDLDKDGIPDIATVNTNDDTLSILHGLGDGSFAPLVTYPVDPAAFEAWDTDLNNDGNVDFVFRANSGVSVIFGLSDGTFGPPEFIDFGATPTEVALGDVDADGVVDVAVLSSINNKVIVRRGRGNGSFYGPQSVALTTTSSDIAIADINDDGIDDLAVTVGFTFNTHVDIFFGLGDGTFAPAVVSGINSLFQDFAFVDLNHDGIVDMVGSTNQDMRVYLGNGDGTFPTVIINEGGATDIAIGDVDRDGVLDVVGNVSVFLGRGDGSLCPRQFFSGAGQSRGVALADLNDDGWLDVTTSRLFLEAIATYVNQWAP